MPNYRRGKGGGGMRQEEQQADPGGKAQQWQYVGGGERMAQAAARRRASLHCHLWLALLAVAFRLLSAPGACWSLLPPGTAGWHVLWQSTRQALARQLLLPTCLLVPSILQSCCILHTRHWRCSADPSPAAPPPSLPPSPHLQRVCVHGSDGGANGAGTHPGAGGCLAGAAGAHGGCHTRQSGCLA
jgi:hypothetical protein